MERLELEADLDRLRRRAQAYLVIGAWAEAGVFDALARGEPPAADARAVDRTAAILVHLGLIRRDAAGWALTDAGRALHARGALAPIGPGVLFPAELITALLRGAPRPITTAIGVMPDDAEATRRFLDRLWERAAEPAEQTAAQIAARVAPGTPVLDLGGGHGRYALALARRGLAATLLDLPTSLEVARDRCGDAVSLVAGDFMVDPLGGPYAAILLSNIVHGLSDDDNRRLLARAAAALAPGGVVAIKEYVLDAERAGPEAAALFELPMLMATAEGKVYSAAELDVLASGSGLTPSGRWDAPDESYAVLFYGDTAATELRAASPRS